MVKCVDFDKVSRNGLEVIAKVKVCHDDDNADDDNDDTRVMTIPRLLFFEKQPS